MTHWSELGLEQGLDRELNFTCIVFLESLFLNCGTCVLRVVTYCLWGLGQTQLKVTEVNP